MDSTNPYQAPAADLAPDQSDQTTTERMSLSQLYLGLEGRVPRKVYWLYLFLPIVILSILFSWMTAAAMVPEWAIIVFNLAIIWPSIAVQAKRWHDRDKSGWWVLIGIVPVIGPIWALIENGFLSGTPGGNRFGPEPIGY